MKLLFVTSKRGIVMPFTMVSVLLQLKYNYILLFLLVLLDPQW